jgi:6,7-dimethyl-8-ribityllumazine synthase
MANVHQGNLIAGKKRFAIVVSRFNEFISQKLLDGAVDCLVRHGAQDDAIDVFWTPGSFEIPLAAKRAAESKLYSAVICLGVIIRGGTPHHEYIASEAAKGIGHVGLSTGVPTVFGVITADNLEQAIERSGTKAGNKGADAALAAIEMANLLDQMPASKKG